MRSDVCTATYAQRRPSRYSGDLVGTAAQLIVVEDALIRGEEEMKETETTDDTM